MKKLLFSAAVLSSVLAFSQTQEEREVIKRGINQTEIAKTRQKFEEQYQKDEQNVQAYLEKHPDVKRSFRKDGNAWYLQRIDSDGNPVFINTKDTTANATVKGTALHTGGSMGVNISGQNMVLGVWDGGQINGSHELLSGVGKVAMQSGQTLNDNVNGGNDHQQAVTGIAIGKDIGNTAKGIAYSATSLNYDWNNDLVEMLDFATGTTGGYLVSNHSYGYGNGEGTALWKFGAYDVTSKNWDWLLKDTPNYLPFVAVGNEQNPNALNNNNQHVNGNWTKGGFDIVTGSSAAKNVVTVGSVESNKAMSNYSNWGPTDDGRVKPDIVAQGSNMDAPLYSSNNGYTGQVSASSGTSYAAPVVAGAALLLQQYYKSIFNKYMTAASLKALLLHTAEDLGNPGPDAKFGWGLLNIEKAAQTIKQMQPGGSTKLIEYTTNPVNDGNTQQIEGWQFSNGPGPMRASICWTDDEGTEQTSTDGVDNTTSRLVYEFDILFRTNGSLFLNSYPYKNLSISNPSANATVATTWFSGNGNNYKQANVATNGAEGTANVFAYVVKKSTSPVAVKPYSLLITGFKITSTTLATAEAEKKEIIFFDRDDNKIKLISNKIKSFGEYEIYDASGRTIQKGNSKSGEIEFFNAGKGQFFLKSKNTAPYKFLK